MMLAVLFWVNRLWFHQRHGQTHVYNGVVVHVQVVDGFLVLLVDDLHVHVFIVVRVRVIFVFCVHVQVERLIDELTHFRSLHARLFLHPLRRMALDFLMRSLHVAAAVAVFQLPVVVGRRCFFVRA